MRTQRDDLGREHRVGAEQCLDAHRRDHVGVREQPAHVVAREGQHPEHAVGAVDEREAFLRLEDDRLEAGGPECRPRIDVVATLDHLALAEQHQRDVRERREVTTATQRAVLGHPRRDAGREQLEQPVGQHRSRPAATHGEGAGAEQHHRSHDLGLDRVAETSRVRSDQRSLQARPARGLDVHIGERAEAGRDAVDGLPRRRQPLDDVARRLHRGPGLIAEHRPRTTAGYRHDVVDGEAVAREDDVGHEFSRPSRFSASVYSFASTS